METESLMAVAYKYRHPVWSVEIINSETVGHHLLPLTAVMAAGLLMRTRTVQQISL